MIGLAGAVPPGIAVEEAIRWWYEKNTYQKALDDAVRDCELGLINLRLRSH